MTRIKKLPLPQYLKITSLKKPGDYYFFSHFSDIFDLEERIIIFLKTELMRYFWKGELIYDLRAYYEEKNEPLSLNREGLRSLLPIFMSQSDKFPHNFEYPYNCNWEGNAPYTILEKQKWEDYKKLTNLKEEDKNEETQAKTLFFSAYIPHLAVHVDDLIYILNKIENELEKQKNMVDCNDLKIQRDILDSTRKQKDRGIYRTLRKNKAIFDVYYTLWNQGQRNIKKISEQIYYTLKANTEEGIRRIINEQRNLEAIQFYQRLEKNFQKREEITPDGLDETYLYKLVSRWISMDEDTVKNIISKRGE
jgi:hypothetical protein